MGDNGTDEFDEEELQRRENQMAEEQAIEDFAGGTGSNDGESEEDNPYDLSRQFTGGDEFTGADEFARIGNSGQSDDDETDFGGDDDRGDSYGGSRYSRGADEDEFSDDFDEPEADNFDGEGDLDTGKDNEADDDYASEGQAMNDLKNLEHGSIITAGGKKYKVYNQGGLSWLEELEQTEGEEKQQKKEKPDGLIKWKKGDPITLDLLYQVWGDCKLMQKVKSLVDAANRAVMEAVNTTGPNLALRLNNYLAKFTDSSQDAIGALLDLGKKTGKRLVFIFTSVIEAIFDQQWVQVWLLSTLPKILETAIATNPLKGILNAIFSVAVPLINAKARKNG